MGDYREDTRNLFENNTEVLLNYDHKVKSFLELSGLIGGNARIFSYNSSFTSTDYLSVPEVYSFSNSLNPVQANGFNSDMRVYNAYYSLDASLGRYATISTIGRVDKSSALPKDHDSYFYPSVSLASVISDYVNLPSVISFLKLRASYAAVHGDVTQLLLEQLLSVLSQLWGQTLLEILCMIILWIMATIIYHLIMVLTILSLLFTQQANRTIIKRAAYYTSNLYDPNIKTFNRVNYEAGFDINFLHNRLGLSATAFEYSSLQPD